MKSPLIDALRQASGQSKAAEGRATTEQEVPHAAAPVGQPLVPTPEQGELSLLEATNVLVTEETTQDDDGVDLAVTAIDIVIDEEPAEELSQPPGRIEPRSIVRSGRESVMVQLALWSPVLSLLLAAATAGAYFAYQAIGGSYGNADLASLSSSVNAATAQGMARIAEPEGPVNHFKLIVTGEQTGEREPVKTSVVPGDDPEDLQAMTTSAGLAQ